MTASQNQGGMQFKRIEEMPVWQDARRLTTLICKFSQKNKFKTDYGLKDQIEGSSLSVMSNIAEGYERNSGKEFLVFLRYANGSIGEVRNQLYVASGLGYIDREEFQFTHDLCISAILQFCYLI